MHIALLSPEPGALNRWARKLTLLGSPNFAVTLVRTPKLPPKLARFCVPLDMNKLDFRDYLFHGYGVRAFNIKTYIRQRPVEVLYNFPKLKGRSVKPQWHRRRAIKFMTVEMDQPFVWPEPPTEEMNVGFVFLRCAVTARCNC
jgi:hypothetical protein